MPSCLSIAEILTVLYFRILNIDPQDPRAKDRDRFILSKGHAGMALYSVLALKRFFDKELLFSSCRPGSILGGHPDMHKVPGVEASTGALGHGFPFAVGVALAGKIDQKRYKVFALLGDGECQEGSVWEAALFAPHHKLDNLTVIIDYNKLQAMDKIDHIVRLEPFVEKWKAFGWAVAQVNGHDIQGLYKVLSKTPLKKNKPTLVIAHTTKGKGISFMENVPIWHYRMPNPQEIQTACQDLGLQYENGAIK